MRPMQALYSTLAAGAILAAAGTASAADTIRFGYPVQVHGANSMIMADHAKKFDLEVKLTGMRRYADLQLALTNNDLDMVVFGYVQAGLMEEKDFTNYKVVAGSFVRAQGLTLANGVKATKWKDLEGLTLGTAPNSYAELLFKTTAKLNGADLSKIKLVSFAAGGPPMITALKDRAIDGFVSWEPNGAEAKVSGAGYYPSLDVADNPTRAVNGLVAVRADFAAAHPEIVVKALKAHVAATDELNKNREKYVEVAKNGTGAREEVLREAIPRGELDYRLHQKEAEALYDMVREAGMIKKDIKAGVINRFDYSFLEKATGKSRKELGAK